jgi:hypothetical protein
LCLSGRNLKKVRLSRAAAWPPDDNSWKFAASLISNATPFGGHDDLKPTAIDDVVEFMYAH